MKSIILLALFACASAKPGYLGYNGLGYAGAPAIGYAAAGPAFGYHAAAAPAFGYAAAPAAVHYAAAPAVIAAPALKTQYHAQDELGQASYGYAHPGQAHAAVRDAAGRVRGSYAYVNPDGNEIRVNYAADEGGFRVESNALPQAPVHVLPGPLVGPAPVLDTPEVAQAKVEHAAAHAEALVRTGRKKRGVIAAPALTYASHAAHTYAYGATPAATSNLPILAPAVHYGANALAYAAAPAVHAYGAPAVHAYGAPAIHAYGAVAAAPALAYGAVAAPAVAYGAVAAPAIAYGAHPVISGPAVREAVLTKVVNTPGHAVSYRVD